MKKINKNKRHDPFNMKSLKLQCQNVQKQTNNNNNNVKPAYGCFLLNRTV